MQRYYSASGAELFETAEGQEAEEFRAQIKAWLDDIPDPEHVMDLRGRLASSDDSSHYSARLEIVVDGLFRQIGWNLTYHPRMRGVSTRPDLLVRTSTKSFICEAVLVSDDAAQRQEDKRLREIVDGLAQIRDQFVVWTRPLTALPDDLPVRRIRAFLSRELRAIRSDGLADSKAVVFEDRLRTSRVLIEFVVFPAVSGADEPVAGMWGDGQARVIRTGDRLKSTLAWKAHRYGRLSSPYLILVWARTWFPLMEHQREKALFGDNQVVLPDQVGESPFWRRAMNGFFTEHKEGHLRNAHVSAVGFYEDRVVRDGLPVPQLAVYHNPFARRPLSRHFFAAYPQMVRQRHRSGSVSMVSRPPSRSA